MRRLCAFSFVSDVHKLEDTVREAGSQGRFACDWEMPTGKANREGEQVQVKMLAKPLAHAIRRLGWRVYATNHTARELSLSQAGLAYRQHYLEERGFGRLKGRALSLTPMYLSTPRRIRLGCMLVKPRGPQSLPRRSNSCGRSQRLL
jgi:transposase